MKNPLPSTDQKKFDEFIIGNDHPCIMAKTIFSSNNYQLRSYEELGSETAAAKILADIEIYLASYDFSTNEFFTFIAVFNETTEYSELEFENLLWKQLQKIHEIDHLKWDDSVSSNPKDDSFSFSIAGNAFYIVGMHPNSSRIARRSPKPALIFNMHWQFEKLREMGVYNRIRNTIRKRDLKKNGSINPMLKDFGKKSEAAQYSGRAVDKDWKCPFNHK